jgi:hypothetical protein
MFVTRISDNSVYMNSSVMHEPEVGSRAAIPVKAGESTALGPPAKFNRCDVSSSVSYSASNVTQGPFHPIALPIAGASISPLATWRRKSAAEKIINSTRPPPTGTSLDPRSLCSPLDTFPCFALFSSPLGLFA